MPLFHGDCLEVIPTLINNSINFILVDPPYGIPTNTITCSNGQAIKSGKGMWDICSREWNEKWIKLCRDVLSDIGTICVFCSMHNVFEIGDILKHLNFKILNVITWEKPNPPPNLACRCFTHSTEFIIWAAKNSKSKYLFNYSQMKAVTGKQMKDVWTFTAPKKSEKTFGSHPTQKPEAIIERLILACTNENDTVLDPMCGSGTTGVVCKRLNRIFIGIEKDEKFYEISKNRIGI